MTATDERTVWLTSAQVAQTFGVNSKTVSRWAKEGRLYGCYIWTPGGSRRYDAAGIQALLHRLNPA